MVRSGLFLTSQITSTMKQERTVYGQLALDFGSAIAPDEQEGGECEIIPISVAQVQREAVKRRGQEARSKFTAFFKEDAGFWETVFSSLDRIEVADEEISLGMNRYPHRAKEIDRVFGALCSTEVLRTIGHAVFLQHIRELINRVGEGNENLKITTDAEVIAGIYGITLITPTKRFVGQAYWHLFQKVIPSKVPMIRDDMEPMFAMPTTEYEQDQVFDFIGGIRKKLEDPTRKLSGNDRRAYDMSTTLRKWYRQNRLHAPVGFGRNDADYLRREKKWEEEWKKRNEVAA